jgi:TRAP-type mannitol/chloroaromatic compound transport system permease small subunit
MTKTPSVLGAVLRVIDRLITTVGKVTSYMAMIIAIIMILEIVLRDVFVRPTIWAHETTQFVFGAYIILAGGYVLISNGHVSMDLFYKRFSLKAKAVIDLITWPLFFIYVVSLLWKGWMMFWNSLE